MKLYGELLRANPSRANLCSGVVGFSRGDYSGPDLSEADFSGADFSGADLFGANLSGANLSGANLSGANLSGANLSGANLWGANLWGADLSVAGLSRANLSGANLSGANLFGANLRGTDLSWAGLSGADLRNTVLVETNFENADLTGCRVYGISAWDLKLEGATQRNLVITKPDEPEITVDNLEVGQFIYLLLHNEKIRHVIDTITSKVVLILGRFTPERKAVLDALREELRKHDYLPVLFDFEKPASWTTDETITLLARMARFVIADITDAKCVLQELRAIVPDTPSLAVQPIIIVTQEVPGMFNFYRGFRGVLPPYCDTSPEQLIADICERVIGPAEAKVRELRG